MTIKTLKMKALGLIAAFALCVGLGAAAPTAVHAQSAYQVQQAQAEMHSNPSSFAVGGGLHAMDAGTGGTTADDFSGYASTFSLVKADIIGFIASVGLLAIGAMVVGKLFPVAWRLTGKAIGTIGKG